MAAVDGVHLMGNSSMRRPNSSASARTSTSNPNPLDFVRLNSSLATGAWKALKPHCVSLTATSATLRANRL